MTVQELTLVGVCGLVGVVLGGFVSDAWQAYRARRKSRRAPPVPLREVVDLVALIDARERRHMLPHSDLVARALARDFLRKHGAKR
jgi:hypothetical protein